MQKLKINPPVTINCIRIIILFRKVINIKIQTKTFKTFFWVKNKLLSFNYLSKTMSTMVKFYIVFWDICRFMSRKERV